MKSDNATVERDYIYFKLDRMDRDISNLKELQESLALSVARLEERISSLEQTPDDPSDIARAKLCNLLERLKDIRGELTELLETRLKHTDQQEKVEANLRLMRGSIHALYNLLNTRLHF